ncbi:helix-turn-helix domain-containing protein [Actinomycetes bacterium KLBMP 9759]
MATIAVPTLFTWQRALRGATLPPTVQHVLLMLATYAGADGTGARPGETRLAADVGLSVSTVRRALAVARRLGWAVRSAASTASSRGAGRADVYRLAIPGDAAAAPTTGRPRPVDIIDERATTTPTTGHQRPEPPSTSARTPSHDHPKKDLISARPAPLTGLAQVAVRVLREVTGRTVDPDHAGAVARQLLGGRHGLADPAAYLATCIRRDSDPHRFLPTPTPPRFVREPVAS